MDKRLYRMYPQNLTDRRNLIDRQNFIDRQNLIDRQQNCYAHMHQRNEETIIHTEFVSIRARFSHKEEFRRKVHMFY